MVIFIYQIICDINKKNSNISIEKVTVQSMIIVLNPYFIKNMSKHNNKVIIIFKLRKSHIFNT